MTDPVPPARPAVPAPPKPRRPPTKHKHVKRAPFHAAHPPAVHKLKGS